MSLQETIHTVRNVMAALPTLQFRSKKVPVVKNAPAIYLHPSELKPKSKRTYYVGFNGRVSQRKQLVGEVHATTRAVDTLSALAHFAGSELNLLPGCSLHIGSK